MTFYEAALRILEGEGRPLHFLDITQKSIAQSLLSHIGKTPEQTMLSRLAAMARRTREKRVIVTAKDTFALIDWPFVEDVDALALTGIPEENPEEQLPPLRPVERHPEQRTENARAAGRQDRKRRRDEDDEGRGRKRRFPPIPEVVFEILTEPPGAMTAAELVGRALERELCSEELSAELVLTALLEDNQRRIDAGRRPQFILSKETRQISLERAGAPSDAPPLELQAAFAELLGIPLEGGRPVLRSVPAPGAAGAPAPAVDLDVVTAAKDAVKEARRATAKTFRHRLLELDPGTFEKSVVKMLHHAHFRELKVAKRTKEGPLLTARRKEGSVEMRFAIRVIKGGVAVERRVVQELRRDLTHNAAHLGLIVSAGEIRGDARAEAQSAGALILLWCGDALAEKFFETRTGVTVTQVELFEPDESFFASARVDAEESQKRREERQREREQSPERPPRREERRPQGELAALPSDGIPASLTRASSETESEVSFSKPSRADARSLATLAESEAGDADDEGSDDDLEAATDFVSGGRPAEAGEGGAAGAAGAAEGEGGRRRRRRRRGRRGRGAKPGEGEPGAVVAAGEGEAPTSTAPNVATSGDAPTSEQALASAPPPVQAEAPPEETPEPSPRLQDEPSTGPASEPNGNGGADSGSA